MDRYLTGKISLVQFKTPGGVRAIDKEIYMRALIHPITPENIPKISHSIIPQIDGVTYGATEVDQCILAIHYAAMGDYLSGSALPELDSKTSNLPAYLSVVDWLTPLIKESRYLTIYKGGIMQMVNESVTLARAILCVDDSKVGGPANRLKLLKTTGLNVELPEFLSTILVVDRANVTARLGSYHTNAICISADYIYNWSRNDSVKVSSYIYAQLTRIVVHENPKFMKIKGFGPQCAALLSNMMSESTLDVLYPGKKISICDIYMYGIGCITAEK
jgi:hypothetical protein